MRRGAEVVPIRPTPVPFDVEAIEYMSVDVEVEPAPLVPSPDHTGLVFQRTRLLEQRDEDREPFEIGHVRSALLDPIRMRELFRRDVFDACDEQDGDLEKIAGTFYEPDSDGDFREEVAKEVDAMGGNILYVDRIEIDPSRRGRGLSLLLLDRAIDLAGVGCALVVAFPRPDQGGRSGRRRLARHLARIGFFDLRGTGYVVRDEALRHPRAAGGSS